MSQEKKIASHPSDRQILSTRTFAVPREKLFQAWTDPQHLAQWWGPKGFTNTFFKFEPRPGGIWSFMMHGPDGTDYPNESRFVEVIEPEKIVIDHLSLPRFRIVATFTQQGEKASLDFQMTFETAETRNNLRELVTRANEENFDRLEIELKKI